MKKKKKNVFIFLIVMYFVYIFINQEINRYNVNNSIAAKTNELNEKMQYSEQLQDGLSKVSTNEYYMGLARERLGFIQKDEIPVINTENK